MVWLGFSRWKKTSGWAGSKDKLKVKFPPVLQEEEKRPLPSRQRVAALALPGDDKNGPASRACEHSACLYLPITSHLIRILPTGGRERAVPVKQALALTGALCVCTRCLCPAGLSGSSVIDVRTAQGLQIEFSFVLGAMQGVDAMQNSESIAFTHGSLRVFGWGLFTVDATGFQRIRADTTARRSPRGYDMKRRREDAGRTRNTLRASTFDDERGAIGVYLRWVGTPTGADCGVEKQRRKDAGASDPNCRESSRRRT
ncbi:hypothetical protein DFH07DRAFT_771155 [Mycena maculata]|uniref:Uncharacterized protein n=1 Tax=Mycena maculata TaxID=230809 RepID=A0AAD7NHF5_9AGAR|nr:hypothetical protein DFH07DRAFT_771155 [Mycena maculata]